MNEPSTLHGRRALSRLASENLKAFLVAIAAGLLFLAGSFARILGDADSAAFGGLVIEASLSQPLWGSALGWNLANFVVALVVAHVLLGMFAFTIALLTRAAIPNSSSGPTAWTLLWFLALSAWVLMANSAWYPLSSLGRPYAEAVQFPLFGTTVFEAATAGLIGAVALTVTAAAIRYVPTIFSRSPRVIAASSALGLTVAASFAIPAMPHSAAAGDTPHVIVIGFDSVRADSVGQADGSSLTPAIDRFLASSTVFTDAITPLARTFPAWVSIVSGKHPHTTGATVNLLPRQLIREGETLPKLLGRAGYRTIYATDEVRFSNLDESYGFDEMIAPPIGATDFLLGFFGDAPLSNLISNTRLGKYLFPYTYANRAAAVTYEPETFIESLSAELQFDRPTLLAVHLTLVHWPYTWSTAAENDSSNRIEQTNSLYHAALARLDRQFDELLDLLERRGALENAIVVVLSDHGEGLGEPQSVRPYNAKEDEHAVRVFGHGTSVFARGQYHTLLAMRSYGSTRLPAAPGHKVHAPVSLEDLTPTVADALQLTPQEPFDGLSLLPWLRGDMQLATERIRFMETEFNPAGIDAGEIMRQSAMINAAKFYQVDPVTDRVSIRPHHLEDIHNGRQYAAVRGDSMLASVPSRDRTSQHLVFVAGADAEPEWFAAVPDGTTDAAAAELWAALSQRFDSVRQRPVALPVATP